MTLDLDLIRFLANREIANRRRRGLPIPPAIPRLLWQLDVAADGQSDETGSPTWITTTELAKELQCSERNARRLAPRLKGRKVGTHWLIPLDSIQETA